LYVGSIVAALRAVSHESDYQREDVNQVFGVVAEVTVSEDRNRDIPYGTKCSEQMHYGRRRVNWRALYNVALEAHDPKALKHEEHVRHDSREATRANKSFKR
jgi:hypothetical protein